jgi:hypothetical protein
MMNLRSRRVHDGPWLRISDDSTVHAFLSRFGITGEDPVTLLPQVTAAFKDVPFENLTKIIKADTVISASSARRHPDELIGDYLRWGTGGTCFSLTASAVALLDALGIDAWPVLADRHYGQDTHCGLIIVRQDGSVLLLDPGYLLFAPVPVPTECPSFFDTGFNRVELKPVFGGARIELYTIVKGNRKLRLTFKMDAVSDEAFAGAWDRSFAFEMMTYPVLTRQVNGMHQYLQGNILACRDSRRTERITLTPEKQLDFFCGSVGISRDIVLKALEVLRHGRAATSISR